MQPLYKTIKTSYFCKTEYTIKEGNILCYNYI
jgi:hypothetical protein